MSSWLQSITNIYSKHKEKDETILHTHLANANVAQANYVESKRVANVDYEGHEQEKHTKKEIAFLKSLQQKNLKLPYIA